MDDPREALREQLKAHGCDWLIDAGADLSSCHDAIVYLDAREEGVASEPPPLEAIMVFGRAGRRASKIALISEQPIDLDVFGPISGYEKLRLGGDETVEFETPQRVKKNQRLRVSRKSSGEIVLENLEEDRVRGTVHPPRVNLLPVGESRPKRPVLDFILGLFR